jgi:transposase-like protein
MRSPRRSFNPEFKAVAVKRVKGGQSLTIAARELNISPQLLRSWVLIANKDQNLHTVNALPLPQENALTQLNDDRVHVSMATQAMNGSDQQASESAIHIRIARHYMYLSKSHKKTANYVLSHIVRTATMPIDQLALAAGISIATANRFARALGFDSYPKFRAEVVSTLDAMIEPGRHRKTQNERVNKSGCILPGSLNEYMHRLALQVS